MASSNRSRGLAATTIGAEFADLSVIIKRGRRGLRARLADTNGCCCCCCCCGCCGGDPSAES